MDKPQHTHSPYTTYDKHDIQTRYTHKDTCTRGGSEALALCARLRLPPCMAPQPLKPAPPAQHRTAASATGIGHGPGAGLRQQRLSVSGLVSPGDFSLCLTLLAHIGGGPLASARVARAIRGSHPL